MILSIIERMLILGILPQNGNISQMRLHQGLITKVGLSPEEIEKYEVKQEYDKVMWRQDLPQEAEIDLKPTEIVFVADALKEKDSKKELTPQHITLYDKFIEKE